MTSGHENLGNPRNVNEEQSPFILPPTSNMFAYYQCWKSWNRKALHAREAGLKVAKVALEAKSKDILRRLHVSFYKKVYYKIF